jgi:RNA polymerase sigma-70 factor (ECF subfamily)
MAITKNIIKHFIAGDVASFDAIYYHYNKKLYYFGLGLLKDPDKASEIVQDVFVTIWEKREQINPEMNFENYLLKIAYNSICKLLRKKSNEQRVKNNLIKNAPRSIENTHYSVIYNDLYDLAKTYIENMPPRQKMVYKLNRLEGLSNEEIAQKLGLSKRTVESHLNKALKYLKTEMAKHSILLLLFFYLFLS